MIRVAVWILSAAALLAGPPLICERIDIGQAKSLPWKNVDGWQGVDPSYSLKTLKEDTLALLTPSTPLNVRMETMRRAAIYASKDPALAEAIAMRLLARVLDGDAAQPMAWFDAGYFVETVRQVARIYEYDMLTASEKQAWKIRAGFPGIDGKQWVRHAMQLGGKGMNGALARMAD